MIRVHALTALALLVVLPRHDAAADHKDVPAKDNDSSEWITREFQIPARCPWWRWWELQIVKKQPAYDYQTLSAWRGADVNSDKESWVQRIQKTTAAAKAGIAAFDGEFPQGSAFLYDETSGTLAVRTTRKRMAAVENLARMLGSRLEKNISVKIEIFESDASVIRSLIPQAAVKSPHDSLREQLLSHPSTKLLDTMQSRVGSGQRGILSTGNNVELIDRLRTAVEESFEITTYEDSKGLRFELDPISTNWSSLVDINLALAYDYAPAVNRDQHLVLPDGKKASQNISLTDFSRAGLTTSLAIPKNSARLLTLWNVPSSDGVDRMQVAFITIHNTTPLGALNPEVVRILNQHADAAEPRQEVKEQPIVPIPKGMYLRTIKLPVELYKEFLVPADQSQSPVDPFAPLDEQEDIELIFSPQKTLEDLGVKFPEGAKMFLNPYTSELQAINTLKNLKSIELFLSSLCGGRRPREIQHHISIIELPEKEFNSLQSQCLNEYDHTALLQKVEELVEENKGRILSNILLGCRSGQRAVFESGPILLKPDGWKFEAPETESTQVDHQSEKKDTDGRSPGSVAMVNEILEYPSGVRLEVDPVIRPQGDIMLNFALQHQPTDNPALKLELLTAIHMADHSTRLVGALNPEGMDSSIKADGRVVHAIFLRTDVKDIDH